jgi:peptide deformylase
MTILDILTYPHPILKQKSLEIKDIDQNLKDFADAMQETLHSKGGLGLAAPQVGMSKRLIIVDVGHRIGLGHQPHQMFNPVITWKSEELFTAAERCYSVFELVEVTRPAMVKVDYLTVDGILKTFEAEGLFAKCLQHEIDHLDGLLTFDHLSKLKRKFFLKNYSQKG